MPDNRQELERLLLASQLDILRLGDDLAKRILRLLLAVKAELEILLMASPTKTTYSREFNQLVMLQTTTLASLLAERYHDEIRGVQADVLRQEFDSLGQALANETSMTAPVLPLGRTAILLDQPLGGKKLDTWIDEHIMHLKSGLRDELAKSSIAGESVRDATSRLRKVFGLSANGASIIARTALLGAASEARHETFRQFDSFIRSYTYMATLDSKTCLICGPDDGSTQAKFEDLPQVPRHPRCRCLIRPNTRFSEPIERPAVTSFEEKVVHHRDGSTSTQIRPTGVKRVTSTMTYEEFFRGQPASWQRKVLGEERYALFVAGKAKVSDFRGVDDRVLTINELRHKLATGKSGSTAAAPWTEKERTAFAHRERIFKSAASAWSVKQLRGRSKAELLRLAQEASLPVSELASVAQLVELLSTTDLRRFNRLLAELKEQLRTRGGS